MDTMARSGGRSFKARLVKPLRWFLAVILLVLAGVGIHQALHERSLASPIPGGVRTIGTVTDVEPFCGRGCSYDAVVTYTVDGRTYTVTGTRRNDAPRIGSPNPVSYDPHNPADAHDIGTRGPWLGHMVISCLFGVLALVIVAFSLASPRWRSRVQLIRPTTGRPPGA